MTKGYVVLAIDPKYPEQAHYLILSDTDAPIYFSTEEDAHRNRRAAIINLKERGVNTEQYEYKVTYEDTSAKN